MGILTLIGVKMNGNLTNEELITNFYTMKHIELVRNLLNKIILKILDRSNKHDQSKLEPPEVSEFAKYTDMLCHIAYGSKEYEECKKKLGPALQHHYAHNRHHPEHFKNGIDDMNIIDLIEMFCDWKASSVRSMDGNIRKSIELNGERFKMSKQLIKILENSVSLLD